MAREHKRRGVDRPGDRAQLRGEVLRLGELLGFPAREIVAFAEAVTGRPWRRCGADEFRAVLEEERSVLLSVIEKATQRAARRQATRATGSPDSAVPGRQKEFDHAYPA